jgi:hypothetical protein
MRPPSVAPGHTLELAGTPTKPPEPGAFAVVFGAPRGDTRDPSEVSLVFNRPMRPLEIQGDESDPPARIAVRGTGAVPKGSWRWMGTSALVFAPETHLPNATQYVVTVPAGTRDLAGEGLAAPFEMEFATPRPRVERLDPGDGDHGLLPGQAFEVRFDQAVEPREVERAATITLGDGKEARKAAFRASRPDPANAKLVRMVPAAPLPLATGVTLAFDASLRGTEGPLPMGKAHTMEMATYGPLRVESVGCWGKTPSRCPAGASFEVKLSNRVSFGQFRSHVRVTQAATIQWSKTRADDALDDTFVVPAVLRAGGRFQVTLAAGMRDEHGQVLAADANAPIDVDDLDPSVIVGVSGTVLEASSIKGKTIPVVAVNTPSYALATGSLDPHQVADLVADRSGYERPEHVFARVSAWPSAHVERVTPGAPRNASVAKRVPVEPILAAAGGHGAFFVGTERELRVVNVTDLAITAKMSRFGSLVWVTHLSDGRPVPGATVWIGDRTSTIVEAHTDADGIAAIAASQFEPADDDGRIDGTRLVYARLGDDWTWRKVGESYGWGDGVYVDASGGLEPLGMLFTDRGVYRPGEKLEIEAIFRLPRPHGTDTPAARKLSITATDAQGDTIFDGDATLDDFGVAALEVPLPATAHLGTTSIRAKMDGERGDGVSAEVQLAAYKASEFKAGVDAEAKSWVRGAQAAFDVHGDYLFGAPMAGAKVHWTATRARGWYSPPGHDAFVVDDDAFGRDLPEHAARAGQVQAGDGALDAKGALVVRVPAGGEGQRGTEVLTLEAEVQDLSRQTIAARATAIVHPASFYVGLKRPADWFLAKGVAVRPEVVAVEPAGTRKSGVAVHVDLVRRTWSNVLEATGESSGHWDARPVDTTVAGCDVTTSTDVASCALTPPQEGYYLVRARAKDEKAREVIASYDVYVIGEGGDGGWATSDSSEVSLVPDKKAYRVGDVARVLVKNPFREADALVTVERSGIYHEERTHLTGATPTLKIPITDDLRPNAFVSVHLVRGRTKVAPARGPDVGAPAFRSGYTNLVVDPESRRLKVAVTPAKKDLRPGETVDADVAVTDADGKPAMGELTLWAVDEGVLMLTGYETPDPLPPFTGPRSLAVFGMESRADMARIFRASFGQLGVDKGDEGGGGGTPMRADFRATAWFQPAVKTGADGRAHVRFKLPDNLTTFRLMAVAVAKDDRFGHGDAQVTTSRPLMVRPALPRFLRAGDAIEAGAIVSTKGMNDARVEIGIAVDGATVTGDAKRTITVKAGQSVEVRWPITAPKAGKAKFSFRAHGGVESDAVEVTKTVEAPGVVETAALEGETKEAAAEKLGELGAVRGDVGGLDVRVASTALVGVGDGMDQLLEYPYGCTEQLTSRLVPLVAARDLAKALGIALPKDPDGLADAAIAKIVANQRSDGGYGWWPESIRSDPWVTAYALWGLDVARRAGRPVPEGAIDRAVDWLRGQLGKLEGATPVELAGRAMVVDVLASIGKPDPGFTDRLYERRADMPLFARALLAHAIVVGKMDASQAQELLRDIDQHLRVTPQGATVVENLGDNYAPVLDSQPRTTAMVLRALVALDPKHALAPRLARGLLGERQNGQWASTHEAAWALLALDDYRKAFEKEAPRFDARAWVGSDLALEADFGAGKPLHDEATLSMARVLAQSDRTLTFQLDGSGALFYEARLRYVRRDLPHDVLDRGFFVRKTLRAVTTEGLRDALTTLPTATQSRVRAGDLVLVDLVLVTPDPREQVVLADPLAAGLEPVDTALATTAQSLDVAGAGGAGDEDDADATDDDRRASGSGWSQAWFRREMRDDQVLTFVEHMPAGMYRYRYLARATTVGKFVVPPTKAECMYDPAVLGRTAASELEVVAP